MPPNATFMIWMPRQMQSVGIASPIGGVQQRDLGFVAVRLDAVDVLVPGPAVSRRVDVAAADEQEAVERLKELLRIPLLTGREDHRPSAGAAQRVEIQARDAVPALRPPGDAVAAQVVRHHGDQGSGALVGHNVECSEGLSRPTRLRRGS